jgi:hypothetical protein
MSYLIINKILINKIFLIISFNLNNANPLILTLLKNLSLYDLEPNVSSSLWFDQNRCDLNLIYGKLREFRLISKTKASLS